MASAKAANPTRVSKKQTPGGASSSSRYKSVGPKLTPLIPDYNRYTHKPSPPSTIAYELLGRIEPKATRKSIDATMPARASEGLCKMVHVMANAALSREQGRLTVDKTWDRDFEHAAAAYLPVREHHVAFITHNLLVTMIGAVVARSLEQATRHKAVARLGLGASDAALRDNTLDLIADRRYVGNITCHDASKTSEVEDVAYSGIMAVNIIRSSLEESFKRRSKTSVATSKYDIAYQGHDSMTTPMANIGFKHHYENNPHHPEHFTSCGKKMPDMFVLEAIVDGLACVLERAKPRDVSAWIGMFSEDRFPDPDNKALVRRVLAALLEYITDEDYDALETFRASVLNITGESCPWACVAMTSCCDNKPIAVEDKYLERNMCAYFDDSG